MNQELERFLNLRNFPARVTKEQAAGILGVPPHEVPILVAKGLLKPLGHPAQNGEKFFLSALLMDLRSDEKWWNKACDTRSEHWRLKNRRKGNGGNKNGQPSGSTTNAKELADAES